MIPELHEISDETEWISMSSAGSSLCSTYTGDKKKKKKDNKKKKKLKKGEKKQPVGPELEGRIRPDMCEQNNNNKK